MSRWYTYQYFAVFKDIIAIFSFRQVVFCYQPIILQDKQECTSTYKILYFDDLEGPLTWNIFTDKNATIWKI